MRDCLSRYTPLGLRFIETPDPTAGGSSSTDPNAGGDAVDLGFPAATPVAEMTAEQQAAYWKHQSRKHERTATARSDYEQRKADSEELQRLKAANATEQEKAVNAALEQGKKAGSSTYLKDAVAGHLRGATGKKAEDIAEALEFIDVTTFTTTDGHLDLDRIEKFANQLGRSDTQPEPKKRTPILDAARRGGVPAGATGLSIAERREASRKSMSPSRNQ